MESEQRKITLTLMRMRISHMTFELSVFFIAQFVFMLFVIFIQDLVTLVAMGIYILFYSYKIKKYKPYYLHYKSLKLEDEFNVETVKDRWTR